MGVETDGFKYATLYRCVCDAYDIRVAAPDRETARGAFVAWLRHTHDVILDPIRINIRRSSTWDHERHVLIISE